MRGHWTEYSKVPWLEYWCPICENTTLAHPQFFFLLSLSGIPPLVVSCGLTEERTRVEETQINPGCPGRAMLAIECAEEPDLL